MTLRMEMAMLFCLGGFSAMAATFPGCPPVPVTIADRELPVRVIETPIPVRVVTDPTPTPDPNATPIAKDARALTPRVVVVTITPKPDPTPAPTPTPGPKEVQLDKDLTKADRIEDPISRVEKKLEVLEKLIRERLQGPVK